MLKKLSLNFNFTKKKKKGSLFTCNYRGSDLLFRMPVPYEPMAKNRFLLRIVDNDVEMFIENPENEPFFNHYGLTGEITLTIRDYIIGEENFQRLVRESGSTSVRYNETTTPKINLEIEKLDPTGVTVSRCFLHNCAITNLEFNMDFDNTSIYGTKVTFKPEDFEVTF